ncbi:MAG: hypothetical protein J6W75_05690 [Bacteroidaceae bacterium]|nr:hypothetical protein [Bacteroidaceae bacterium]
MKKILLFFMLLSATSAFAQDVIVKKDGSTIVSKVLEITATDIKYKKFSNLNGPTYTIAKADVQAINYENGEKETFDTVVSTQAQNQLPSTNPPFSTTTQNGKVISDSELLRMAGGSKEEEEAKIKKLKIAGWVVGGTLVAGGIVLACLTIPGEYDKGWVSDILDKPLGLGIGIPMIAAGIATTTGCLIRAHKLQRRSLYSVQAAPLFQHDFALYNGSTLSTGFDLLKDSRFKSQTIGLGIRFNF